MVDSWCGAKFTRNGLSISAGEIGGMVQGLEFPALVIELLSGLFAIGAVCWLFIDPRRAVFESGTEGEHTDPFVPRTNRQ